jgi:thioester reductase-like protein
VSTTDGSAVLLTGATGFLGGALAVELLRRTSKTVCCVVRGRSVEGAEARLRAHLAGLGLAASEMPARRLTIVRGDLGEPRLGLSPADYDHVSGTMDAVYHCAASLNLAAGYDRLRTANVGGTRAVIGLVASGRRKTLHHISTLGVFLAARSVGHSEVDEHTKPTLETAGQIGYARTKAEAEAEIVGSGIPAAIYRPGLIIADSRTGVSHDTDLIVRLVRAAVALGLAPACAGEVPLSSVDFVARTILELSVREDAAGHAFHPVRPQPFRLRELFSQVRDYGYPVEDLTVADWKLALGRHRRRREAFVISAIWPFTAYMLAADAEHTLPLVRSTDTWASLGPKHSHPALDDAYFRRMLDHITDRWL